MNELVPYDKTRTAFHVVEQSVDFPDVKFYQPDEDRIILVEPGAHQDTTSDMQHSMESVFDIRFERGPVHVRVTPGSAVTVSRRTAEKLSLVDIIHVSPVRRDAARTFHPRTLLAQLGYRPELAVHRAPAFTD